MNTIITAQMVGDLREKTGAGLLDCKKALTESNGNVEDAITILRKRAAYRAAFANFAAHFCSNQA